MTIHRYTAAVTWEGSTGSGYRAYDRTHSVSSPPADAALTLSADPAFRGQAALLNPEQLLVAAASSCQLLSFLAVAARRRIDVLAYTDRAEGLMDDGASFVRFSRIVLRPTVAVAPGTDHDRVREATRRAHEECYVANTLGCPVEVEVTVAEV